MRTVAATLLVPAVLSVQYMAFGQAGPGGKWEAPPAARAMTNPVPPSPRTLEEALALYRKNCLTCHGEAGKGDGPATQFVKPNPADLSSADLQARTTDGEIFWKITEGRNPMPPFKMKLSEEERWKLVHYVRSLGAK